MGKHGMPATVTRYLTAAVPEHPTGRVELVADHVDRNTWNNDPSNLVPSCTPCNVSRHQLARETCLHGHEWTDENTYSRVRRDGRRSRECRICHRTQEAARK